MTKKDSVAVDLSRETGESPGTGVPRSQNKKARKSSQRPKYFAEPTSQFSFELRKSLRKQLMLLATEVDMTMRAFVLRALKEKGLNVTEADLVDMRKQRG